MPTQPQRLRMNSNSDLVQSLTYKFLFGAIATALTVPLIILLDALFRYRKPKIKSDAMRLENITSNGCLPNWFSYIGYILCILSILSGFMVPFFYSLQWGKETSNDWLMSVYFGTLADMTLGPLKVCMQRTVLYGYLLQMGGSRKMVLKVLAP